MGLTVLTFTAAEWQNIVAATKVRRRKRKPWPSCDCGRPRMDSLWQHDPGCAASVDFYRAYAEQQRLRRDDSA